MNKIISKELLNHAPFTMFGAATGIVVMFFFQNVSNKTATDIFYILHPLHVLLSALVTAAIYKNYQCNTAVQKCNLFSLLFIGYVGSVGIATLSDSLIPYIAEALLGLPNKGIHLGFIEKWWLVNPLAILGIFLVYLKPSTKFPHAAHVLLSTWASLFHIIMALGHSLHYLDLIIVFIFLFLAVWFPCCLSDIVFPLLFIKKAKN